MLGWLYFQDVEHYFQFLFISFAFGYRYGLELPSKFFPQPKLACYYRPERKNCLHLQDRADVKGYTGYTGIQGCISMYLVYSCVMCICNDWCKGLYQLDSLRAFFSLVSLAGLSSTAFHLLLLWVYAKRRAQDAWTQTCKVIPGQWNHTILRKKRLFMLFMILLVLTSWSRLCIFWNPRDTKNWQSFWSVSPKCLQWVQLDSLWAEDLRTSWLQLCLESFWNALHRALRCLAGLSKDVEVQTSTGRFYNSAVCPSMSIIGSNNCHVACWRKRHLKYFKVF